MKLYDIKNINKTFYKNRDLYMGLYLILIKHRLGVVYVYSILSEVHDLNSIHILKNIVQMFDRFYDYINNVDLDSYNIADLNNSVRNLYKDLEIYKQVLFENDPVVEKVTNLLNILVDCLSNYNLEEVTNENK